MVDVFVVLLSLILLIYFAYKGISVLYLAPLLAGFAVVMSSEKMAIAVYTDVFMSGVAGFLKSFFPLFLLGALSGEFLRLADLAQISPEVLHRTAVIASGGLDSLPHNGAVITLLAISRLTHKQSYLDIGVVTVAIPVLALAVILFIQQWGVL